MRKITNLLVCLVLALLASTNAAASIKVKVKAVDATGAQISGLVSASNSEELDPDYGTGVYTTILDEDSGFYLYAEDNGDYTFDSWWSSTAFGNYDDLENFLLGGLDEGSNTTKTVAFEYQGELEGEEDEDGYVVFYARFTAAGQTIFTPQYYKVKIVPRKHATGSSSMSNGGGRYYVSTTASTPSSSLWKTTTSGWPSDAFETGETNIVDFYLYAQNFNNYVFEGWYKDASCTDLISTGTSYHYTYTQADLDACDEGGDDFDLAPRRRNAKAASGTCPPVQFTTKSTSSSAVATTIYAKFRDAFEPKYYNVRAQVVSPNGNIGGQVFVSDGDFFDDPEYTDDHYDSDYAYQSTRSHKVYVDLYAQAKEGYVFEGWYADEECTIPLEWNNDYTDTQCTYTYNESNEDNWDLPLLFETSTSSGSAPLNTVYAKFRSTTPQTYYGEVRYLADENSPKRGGYYVVNQTTNVVPITANVVYSATVPFSEATTSGSASFGPIPTYYRVPARGYALDSWTLTNATKTGVGNLTSAQCNFNMTATSTDQDNPTVATLSSSYKADTQRKANTTIKAGHGSVSVTAENWMENDAHTGLEFKSIDLVGTEVGTDSVDFTCYALDTLTFTAIPEEGYQFREWDMFAIKSGNLLHPTLNDTKKYSPAYRVKLAYSQVFLKAYFDKLNVFQYAASASATTGGSVQVSFTNPIPGAATTSASGESAVTISSDTTVTAYFKAVPAAGFEFVRWEENGVAVAGANAEYNRSFTVTSTDSENPTTLALHAVFQEVSDYEAQVMGLVGQEADDDGVLFTGSFADAYAFASNGQKIVLTKNVALASATTIDKNITIDFNNFKLTGTVNNLITIASGKTVNFEDNSAAGAGGVSVTTSSTSDFSGILVSGTLNFYGGEVRCTNTSTTSTYPTRAIKVADVAGSALYLRGGNVITNVANQKAHGVGVWSKGIGHLESGSISATAAKGTAYGVVTNGNLTVTWSVNISATVTSGNDATGVRLSNTNNYSTSVTISGGTISANASGSNAYALHVVNSMATISGNMAAIAEAGTATTAYALYEENANSSVTVETGRFKSNNTTKDVYKASGALTLEGGYYVHDGVLSSYMAEGVIKGNVQEGTRFYTEGYRFELSNGENPNFVVATANGKNFSSLEDAILYANNNPSINMTIIMKVPEYTLPAGTYTLPSNATLLLPVMFPYGNELVEQDEPKTVVDRDATSGTKPSPAVYETLTLANGAHLYVHGNIEVGGRQHVYGTPFTGCPTGPYCSVLQMESGSKLTLSNGANLYAWGFVQGQGEIDVRRGGTVHEQFQISDFKGGSVTYSMRGNEYKTFPLMSYFIQNVEVATTYRPGAHLLTYTGFVSVDMDRIMIIGVEGEAAMFVMRNEDDSEDTWVRKWYDVAHDQQVYDINNAAKMSQMEFELSAITFNSADYDLPLTSNMKIHLLSGEMEIAEDVVALPGVDIEVNKLSKLVIKEGKRVTMLDSDEWGNYLYSSAMGRRIKFRPGGVPTVRDISSAAGIGDAKLNIHGTLDVRGSLYASAGGSTIYSTNADAGTITFTAAVPAVESQVGMVGTVHATGEAYVKYGPNYEFIATAPALLTNAASTTPTSGLAAETSFCYINNAWRNMEVNQCLIVDRADPSNPAYFAKPQEFVAITSGTEDANHLYHSQVGNRKFITSLDRDGYCQWWEVEDVAGHAELVHCIHPENDVYYYYDNTEEMWVEKRFTITWKNWDGATIESYQLRYGSQPQYLGSTPTRERTDYYTYDFAGWSPALTTVTADATYTAQFSQTDRKYLITFNDGTNDIETQYLHMGDIPVCVEHALAENEEWTPAISPVTGDATYTLTSKNVTGPFTITFVNWNGAELQSSSVETGETPVYSGAMPVKPSLGDENYTFIGWTPSIVAASANAVYMATFEATQVTGLNIVDAQTIADTRELTDLRVTTTGTLNVTGRIDADNFYLESNGSNASGQIIGGSVNIHATNIYFDLKINAKNHKWYGVAVPWQVDAQTGISVNGKTLVLGKDFDIVYYDGARRAAEGKKKCWKYVENDGDKTLQPGRLYMIGLMMDAPTIRFAKKADASLLTTTTSVSAYAQTTGDVTDANWNGVANPALFHAFVNAGALVGQVYNPETNSYDEIPMNTTKMVVGQGAFVQAPSNKDITVAYGGAYAAPRRVRAEEAPLYDVRIAPAEAEYTDRLFVRVEDEKEADKYVIGKDLEKLGVSKSVAQMWINRYNTELCLNTMTIENGVAEYPLSIFAPKAGEYTITNEQSSMSNEYTLYLTFNGEAIWNLSEGAYTGTFDAGTTSAYGLRISARAPQITTGIDEAVVDAKGETRKVLINDKVFIIRGEHIYSADGQLVK